MKKTKYSLAFNLIAPAGRLVVPVALVLAGVALWHIQFTSNAAASSEVLVAPTINSYIEYQKLKTDGSGGSMGFAVAIDGTTAVAGAPNTKVGNKLAQGSAVVFVRSGATWTQQQQLFASDGAAFDYFGLSVAINGETIVIGAPKGAPADTRQGAAYIFVRTGTTWTQQQRLAAIDGTPTNFFGYSVSINSKYVAIGVPKADIGIGRTQPEQGAVCIFTRTGVTWIPEIKLTANDGAARDNFGSAISFSGASLAVGAPADDIGVNNGQGSVYLFEISVATWPQRAKLTASDGAAGDFFGTSVALDGATLLVGAPNDTIGANSRQGAAYVFISTGSSANQSWSQQSKLMLNDGAPDDRLGTSVALNGNTVALGASTHRILNQLDQGAVYLFTRVGTIWSRQQELLASDGSAQHRFGLSVTLSGDTIFIGAPGNETAYVFKESLQALVVTVSAANFSPASVANEAIVAAFGVALSTGTQSASSFPLPTSLAGTSATIKDSTGALRLAPLFFVSPGQLNLQIPSGTATGAATILITSGDGTFSGGALQIQLVAPSLFAANANGQGVAAALALRVKINGAQSYEPVAQFDVALNRFVAAPIDLGPAGDQVFLVLYGTGIRFCSSLSAVSCALGGVSSETLFAGPAPGFVGLDQVNVSLPRTLAGRGEVEIALSVDGKAANPVRVSIR